MRTAAIVAFLFIVAMHLSVVAGFKVAAKELAKVNAMMRSDK